MSLYHVCGEGISTNICYPSFDSIRKVNDDQYASFHVPVTVLACSQLFLKPSFVVPYDVIEQSWKISY